ncbi:hypothetical protein AB0C10_37540 [Microbispora amethystogenes]|uniref:hypothetical protein n=1 Tax=Microbispora amethystogenes TaxID=1427754 RepID=UPI00340FFE8F
MKATVHVAGPPELGGYYQTCARCGHVLIDLTGSTPMVVEGQDPVIPVWPTGERVATIGNATYVVPTGRQLGADEIECRAAS